MKTWPKNMVFLDANILLELLLGERTNTKQVAELLLTLKEPTAISLLSAHLVFHFSRKENISDKTIHAALTRHTLIALEPADYIWAKENEVGKDFEDALQVATAVRTGCKQFITLDRTLAQNYAKLITCLVP